MIEKAKQLEEAKVFPEKPAWLNEFRQRTLLIEVIEKAFDPNVSDKEVRDGLVEAAQALKDLGIPPGVSPKV